MEFVSHPWIAPNTIEKRKYQEHVVASAIDGNTLVVLPTGLGKTSIAALVAAFKLQRDMNKKILFLAPTRPLVEQQCVTFGRYMRIGLEMKVITGSTNPADRKTLYLKADVIFSTPQTIENDLKSGILSLENFSVCIFDEAHRAVGNYAYPYIAKAYMASARDPLIVALTASPGAERAKIEEVKRMLFIKNVEIRSRDDDDVKPYVHAVEQERIEVELTEPMKSLRKYITNVREERIKKLMTWGIIKTPNIGKAYILKLQEELSKNKTGYSFAAMSVLAEILKLDHALVLLETQSLYSTKKYFDRMLLQETRAVERLIREDGVRNAMRLLSELVEEGQEHPKLAKLKEIVKREIERDKFSRIMVFAQYRDTIEKIYNELLGVEGVNPVQFIGQAKKSGKGLSQKEQVQILNEFKMGFHNVLVASSVGEEGLDVAETNVVVFYEPISSAVRKIQRSGRTARTQAGRVVVLMTKGTRDEAYHWAGFNREKNMKKILYGMSNSLKKYV
ncbi:MAG: DEAD/DEAH box helicase family protein [Candidatus Aenigmarchaeota archaeon]|nr:DEAD/DEAH box helicase family protein [Candidatus Aenigmarchaeota archaeon]